jgi:hypothetical protein
MGNYALRHYWGVFCPHCIKRIPTLWNGLSAIIALALSPIWLPIWFLRKEKIIEAERTRAIKMLEQHKAEQ